MLDALRRDGVARIAGLTPAEAGAIRRHLDRFAVYNAHVVAKATTDPAPLRTVLTERRWPAFCHPMIDAVTAPFFFEAAIATLPLAAAYFGEPPLLYSMNAFWTQPAPGAAPYLDTHGWHHDGDDRKQLVVFALGTDVRAAEGGAHYYQRGTHLVPDEALGRDFRAPPADIVETIDGPAGTAWVADTAGLHVGEPPRSDPRLLLWARWGVSDPPVSYHWDRLEPVPRAELGDRYPADPAVRSAIRLVVA